MPIPSHKKVKRAVQITGQPSIYGLSIIIERFGIVISVDKSEPLSICKSIHIEIVIDDRKLLGST